MMRITGESYWHMNGWLMPFLNWLDNILLQQQHWITAVGFVATLIGLVIGYIKVKDRIDKFRLEAVAHLTTANLATAKAMVEVLLSGKQHRNLPLLLRQMMDISSMLIHLRGQMPDLDSDLKIRLQESIAKARMFEEMFSLMIHQDKETFKHRNYISFLSDVKEWINEADNATSLLIKDGKNDTKSICANCKGASRTVS